MGSYQEVKGHPLESTRIPPEIGGVMEVYKAEPIRCLRAVETLVQPQTLGQVF